MSDEFTKFVNLCISANGGTGSFTDVTEWLLNNRCNEELLLSEGPIDFLLKLKAPVDVLRTLLDLQPKLTRRRFSGGRMALHLAAYSSVTMEVIDFIYTNNRAAIQEQDSLGNTPLHCAVMQYAPVPIISYLVTQIILSRQRNVMVTKNKLGQTPLHIACSSNPTVILLLSTIFYEGEVLTERDKDGNTPLHLACFNRNSGFDLIHRLITLHPEALRAMNYDGNRPLHMACAGKAREEIIQKLLQDGPGAVIHGNANQELPLHVACKKNAPPYTIVRLLSAWREAAHQKDKDNNLPIHLACRHPIDQLSLEILEALLRENPMGAAVKNLDGMVPSCYIKKKTSNKLISYAKTAIIAGYSVNLVNFLLVEVEEKARKWKDENGNSLLHHACMKSGADISCETVSFLVNCFPKSTKIVNNNGNTAKDLLKKAACYKDEDGRLLLHRLTKFDKPILDDTKVSANVINFVADAYPNSIAVPDKKGMLPLHHACLNYWCDEEVVFALLQRYPTSLAVTSNMASVEEGSKKRKLG